MTWNWYDTRASTWYEGYNANAGPGTNAGNFINLKSIEGTPEYGPALQAVTNNLIGLFEQKGITSAQAQASPEFTRLLELAKGGDTKGAFQGGASAVSSARDRGDLWGADVSEGGEQGYGKSYLLDVAAGNVVNQSIEDLYNKGLLRDLNSNLALQGNVDYWKKELADWQGQQFLQNVISGNAGSTSIEDLYKQGLGRDPTSAGDQEGLTYWQTRLDDWPGQQYLKNVIAGNAPNTSIEDLYKQGFRRDPTSAGDQEGLTYWGNELKNYNAAQYLRDVGSGKITPSDISELWTKGLQQTPTPEAISWGEGHAQTHGGISGLADWMSTNANLPQGQSISKIAQSFSDQLSPGMTIEKIAESFSKQLSPGLSMPKIAESFLLSNEALIQDVYHEQYGRMAEKTGLDYWQKSNVEDTSSISDAQNLLNVITYRGEDLDGDGVITAEERAASEHKVSAETGVRDDTANLLGLVSNEEHRESMAAADAPFTAANNADVAELVDYIRNADDSAAASVNANTLISYLAHAKDALNLGNVDDSGDQATHMGQFGTKEEIKNLVDTYVGTDTSVSNLDTAITSMPRDQDTLNDLASTIIDKTGQETWGALTEEETKTAEDVWVPWTNPFGATYTADRGVAPTLTEEDATQILQPESLEQWKKHGAWKTKPTPGTGTDPANPNIPIPTKPSIPAPIPRTTTDINYMPSLSSDVQDTSGYGAAKTQFETAQASSQPQDVTAAPATAGKRFINKSAQGVRRKRSAAAKSGRSLGTQALNRMQINSLNV